MARFSESGDAIEAVYGPKALQDFDPERDLGEPGEFPFTRGVYPTMYAGRPWTMRQYAGFSTAAESNHRYRQLIAAGTTGLSVAIDSVEDMQALLSGIPLDSVSTSMTINAPAPVLLLLYELVAAEQGIAPGRLNGTVQNDILKEYIARGTYIYPPVPSLRLVADTFAYCGVRIPRWNTISISGYHMAEAGATPVQEVAFTLANAKEYVRTALESGLAVDDFAPRLSFFFVARTTLLEEVAKFRAARWLWAHIMADEFGAEDPRSQMLRFHTQTAGVQLTAQQPEVNMARVTVQALAAVLGGTQSLHTNSYDEAIALPSEKAARLALRTQQVLAYETDLTATADPFAGSYAVESMTTAIRDEAAALIGRVEQIGGAVAAIERGFQKAEIERSAYQVARQIEAGERVVVGVNKFAVDADESYAPLRVDPAIEQQQAERLADLRRRRDSAAVRRCLDDVKRAAEGQDNVLYPLREALAARATVGEACDALREIWGVYRPADVY
jgi:methylmalonyl-CoA mutase N-terminal domain/subunit